MAPEVDHNSSRSNDTEPIVCLWGKGDPGEPFLAAFAELDVATLIEASCPWLPPGYIEAVAIISESIRAGVLKDKD